MFCRGVNTRVTACLLCKSSLFFSCLMLNKNGGCSRGLLSLLWNTTAGLSECVCVSHSSSFQTEACHATLRNVSFSPSNPVPYTKRSHTLPGHSSWALLNLKKVTQTCSRRLSKHGWAADSTGMMAVIFRLHILSLCSGRPTKPKKPEGDSPADWCMYVRMGWWGSAFVMQKSRHRNRFPRFFLFFLLFFKISTTAWSVVVVGTGGSSSQA